MRKLLLRFTLSGILLLGVSCSKRERSDPDAEEWADIEEMADAAQPVLASTNVAASDEKQHAAQPEADEAFAGFAERLKLMRSIDRASGQTLLTGDALVFDYEARTVQMDGNVLVEDDRGQLKTDRLQGRLSAENEVEHIHASGGISIVSGSRKAHAEQAVCDYLNGTVQLDGQAELFEGENRLAGERIRFWIKGNRQMICEPNALLIVAGRQGLGMDDMPDEIGDTEIRANRILYDESKRRVDVLGNVRLRNPQVAMNCSEIHLYLKDANKMDWLEAVGGVIIQSEDRKALADRATYVADEGKFTLEGQPPMVKQGRNVLTGDRITFWHKTRALLCEPNGRILYYYDLDEETQARFPKDLND
jgi:lipopolysaccharide export system protein LptA